MEKTGVVIGRDRLAAAGGRDGVAARRPQQPGRSAARKRAKLLEKERGECF